MGKPKRKRRQQHGSAWYWKQTGCWYYTLPGTKQRVSLFGEQGARVRGVVDRDVAEHALTPRNRLLFANCSSSYRRASTTYHR